jgi:hypothetical protein
MGVKDHRHIRPKGRGQNARTVDVNQIRRAFPQDSPDQAGVPDGPHAEAHQILSGSRASRIFPDRKRMRPESAVLRELEHAAVSRRHHFRLPSAPAYFRQDVSKAQLRAAEIAKLIQKKDPHACSRACRAAAPSTQK